VEPNVRPLRVGFLGAGRRASAAHYPSVARLQREGGVQLVAICDLDERRLATAADRYGVGPEGRHPDLERMLREARLDAVYAILPPTLTGPVVLRLLEAGVPVFMEKPPGISAGETRRLVEAAERSGRWAMVGLQRRFTSVVREAQRRVAERGPLHMCLVEFHKDIVTRPEGRKRPQTSTLVDDLVHVVDLCRHLCGGRVDEPPEVHVLQDAFGGAAWPNCYSAVVRFASGAHGLISGDRSSGGRVLRVELHGTGVGCYIDPLPDRLRILADNGRIDATVTGAELAGSEDEAEYEGILEAHRHFVACIRGGRQPLTDVRDVLGTMRLVAQLESPFWEEYAPD